VSTTTTSSPANRSAVPATTSSRATKVLGWLTLAGFAVLVALAFAWERLDGLEVQVALLQEQLEHERGRNSELVNELKAAQAGRGLRWRFWRRGGDHRALTGSAGGGMTDSKTIN